ncbi:phosphomannomutase [Cognatiyoonia sp. IB215446]|uniref:phosphomannomutase n=1 Tax=Cognatiyoonia sp. IB215446 TaxID=3097355 RepID=UPI002A0F8CA2|nr:phosphomannomutase [Cognatiyoonia sp. IB215446]MDX8346905.1 phosphomannomutase [Cognatiyoonia sp. IB215446]
MTRLSCFKAYDIRGQVDVDLTEDLARDLGRAIATVLEARTVVLGRDARAASPRLLDALAGGLTSEGIDVLDLGLCGTEEVYFGTDHYGADAGVMVTASHNPIEFNGFKLVGAGAAPLPDNVFRRIEAATTARADAGGVIDGSRQSVNCRDAYVARVLSFVDVSKLGPLKILANAGNGAAGPTFDAVIAGLRAKDVAIEVERLHHDPDPAFPNGIPNPLLPENQPVTAAAVVASGADFGIAWDGDFDRCFFFDHTGAFIPGEYVVGLLAGSMLERFPGEGIVHDPRVYWNTQEVIARAGGRAIVSKTGHALIKAKMRETNAVYGGEMSAHHYFRDFMHCDSGMIPWLLIAAYVSQTGQTLYELVADMRGRFQSSGEINFRVDDAGSATERVHRAFAADVVKLDRLDGLSLEMTDWRLNLRSSNTEPLLRLNVEAKTEDIDLSSLVGAVSQLIEI